MGDSLASSSFAALLRRSKFATYSPNIGQVYTSPLAAASRGDWGIKSSLFPEGKDHRSKIRHLAIPEIDSVLGLPVWKSAEKSARFIRQWGGEGIAARIVPQPGVNSWSTSNGTVPDPWAAQAGRIAHANKAIDKLHSDKFYAQFVEERFTNLTQHHYLLHDFFLDRLVKSKFIDASVLAENELPPLTNALLLSSPEQRIDVSQLDEEKHLASFYHLLRDSPAIQAEWEATAELRLSRRDLALALAHIQSKALVLTDWARISAELQLLKKPYSSWKEAAASVARKAGSATEYARVQAKAVFAAQPSIIAQLRTTEGRAQAEAQWKAEWAAINALASNKGLSVAEWKSGSDSWEFELRNLRSLEKAKEQFLQSRSLEASTSSFPPAEVDLDKKWESIVDYSFSHHLLITNWQTILAEVELEQVDSSHAALDSFLFRKALAVYPDWLLVQDLPGQENPEDWEEIRSERIATVQAYGEVLGKSEEVQAEWKAVVEQLEQEGKSFDEYVAENDRSKQEEPEEVASVESGPIAAPTSSNFGKDAGSLLASAPDIESMTNEDFAQYVEDVKRLQPAYRRHLSEAFNTIREQRHRQLAGLPSDDPFSPLSGRTHAAYGLSKAPGLNPKEQAASFLDTVHHIDPRIIASTSTLINRHPTGGLQYSLPTKIEINQISPTVPGLHVGHVYVEASDSSIPAHRTGLSSVGGLIVGEPESKGRAAPRLDAIDQGLSFDGTWRDETVEPRDPTKGHYNYRVGSASINEPPRVVSPRGRLTSRLHPSTINKGPYFQEETPRAIRANATADFSSGSSSNSNAAAGMHSVSQLGANERKSLRIGSPEWVANKPRMTNQVGGGKDFSSFRRGLSGEAGGKGIGMSRSGRSGDSTRRLLDSLKR